MKKLLAFALEALMLTVMLRTTGANDFVSTATAAALMALLGAAALLRK